MWIWLIAFSFSFDGALQLSGFVLTTMKVWHGDGSSFTDAFFFLDTMSELACEPIHSTNETSSQMTQWENGSASLNLIKKAVVVLTRLPDYKISALRPPTPQQSYSEAEFSSSSGSDMQWQPEDDSTDSDFSVSNNNQKSDKNSSGDTRKPSNSSGKATNITTWILLSKLSNNFKIPLLTFALKEINPSVGISPTSAHCSHETTNIHPNLPQDEVKVDMMVLARKKRMKWQRGKIVEIISKGKRKYRFFRNYDFLCLFIIL